MKVKSPYLETVPQNLWEVLTQLMKMELLAPFRLVGGTALTLQLGHRMSVDIDLFTDSVYGSLDFTAIDKELQKIFTYVDMQYGGNESFGKIYFIGNSKDEAVKVDLFYTDAFICPVLEMDSIRLASIEEISAMKLEVIGNTGRKKDFWDVHALFEHLTMEQMLSFHAERYPYSCTKETLLNKLVDFQFADDDFEPICLKGNYWELIKEDIREMCQNELCIKIDNEKNRKQ